MVGKGVLLECLDDPFIKKVLVINRSTLNMDHPKLVEILLSDFTQIGTMKKELKGYDACFYCMGISALGLSEEQYTRITYTTAKAFADVLYELNPAMLFTYVSGMGTDSSEKGRSMWARVKGRTENMILHKGFKDVYAFRPGFIIPEKGIKSRTRLYNTVYTIMRPLFPVFRRMNSVTTTSKLGRAMINLLRHPGKNKILENKDINKMADRQN